MGEVICGLVAASCKCIEPYGHEGPHRCGCEGSWSFDEHGVFEIVSLPDPLYMTSPRSQEKRAE